MSFDCSIFLRSLFPVVLRPHVPAPVRISNRPTPHIPSSSFAPLVQDYSPSCSVRTPITILSGISAPNIGTALGPWPACLVEDQWQPSVVHVPFRPGSMTPINISAANATSPFEGPPHEVPRCIIILSCFQIAALEAASRRLLQSLQRPFVGGRTRGFSPSSLLARMASW